MSLPRICLYMTGDSSDRLRAEHGPFVDWFERLFARHHIEVEIFDGQSGRFPDRLERFAGIVISGSPASLTQPEPWMEAGVELIRLAYRRRTPLLGVCFGHQLIGAAFGGSVVENPAGWQIATRALGINRRGAEDPLFDGVGEEISVNFSHRDIVQEDTLSPFNGVEILASNQKARAGALAAGPTIRGVQFHPEMSGAIARTLIDIRRDELAEAVDSEDHEEHPETLTRTTRDAPDGEQVFDNFLQHFILEPRRP